MVTEKDRMTTHLCFLCADILRNAYPLIPVGGMRKEMCANCGKKRMGQMFEGLQKKPPRVGGG